MNFSNFGFTEINFLNMSAQKFQFGRFRNQTGNIVRLQWLLPWFSNLDLHRQRSYLFWRYSKQENCLLIKQRGELPDVVLHDEKSD